MKKATLLCCLLFWCLGVQAQSRDSVSVWKIDYGMTASPRDFVSQSSSAGDRDSIPDKKNLKQMLLQRLYKKDGMGLMAFITKTRFRIEDRSFSKSIHLVNTLDSTQFVMDSAFKSAREIRGGLPKVVSVGDSILIIDPSKFQVDLSSDKTITILGYECRKAVVKNPQTSRANVIVWYAPDLPKLYWGKYSYLKKLPGCPLLFYASKKAISFGLVAQKIQKINVASSLFEIPEDYEIIKIK